MLREIGRDAGGTGDGVIVTVALADFVVSVNDVATIVTVSPVGTAEGAVYVVVPPTPLVVCGLNEPQEDKLHVAVQITPSPIGSFVTSAARLSVLFVSSELGGVVP